MISPRALVCLLVAGCIGGCDEGASDSSTPEQHQCLLPVGIPRVIQVESNDDATMALRSDGSVWCWGEDAAGACGGGLLPYPVKLLPSCLLNMDVNGGNLGIGQRDDGAAVIWGPGNLDIDYGANSEVLIHSLSEIVSPRQLHAGYNSVTVMDANGSIWFRGMIGSRFSNDRYVKLPFKANAVRIAGRQPLCALYADGTASCIGNNQNGVMGFRSEVTDLTEPTALNVQGEIVELESSVDVLCVLLKSGEVQCAGNNLFGVLASPGVEQRASFEAVPGLPHIDKFKFASSDYNICAMSGSDLWCWGSNAFHPIAEGPDVLPPTLVEPFHDIVDFASGGSHLCVLRADGSVWCRGWQGSNGRCEDGEDWGEVKFEYCDG